MTTISDLRNAIKKLEDHRETIDTQLANLRGALQYFENQMPTREESRATPPAKAMRNEMVFILEGAGAPLHYRDIHTRLVERGFPVPGARPENNVGAHLSTDKRFNSLGKGMWGLTRWAQNPPPPQEQPSEPPAEDEWINDLMRSAAEDDKTEAEERELDSIPF